MEERNSETSLNIAADIIRFKAVMLLMYKLLLLIHITTQFRVCLRGTQIE